MLAVVVGLTTALVYGAADFFGGLAAKRSAAVIVTWISILVGFVGLLPFLVLLPTRWSSEALFWGGLSGITGSMSVLFLYAALAIGPMSILSPLTAVLSAIVPMTFGLLTGDRLSPLAWVAIAGILVAVVLVGFVPEKGAVRPRARGIGYGVIAGVLIGAFFILVDQAPDDSGVLPIVANRVVAGSILSVVVVVLVLWARRRGSSTFRGVRGAMPVIIACGLADAAANVLLLVGLRLGDLTIVSVLTALYPAGTIALAAIVLRERIAPVQWAGLALAVGAAALLALA